MSKDRYCYHCNCVIPGVQMYPHSIGICNLCMVDIYNKAFIEETIVGKIKDEYNEKMQEIRNIAKSIKPSNQDNTTQAQRFNQGKPQLSYIDLSCLEPCARVMEFGAKKYSRGNWQLGMETSKIIDSLLRHLSAIQRGEIRDPESGELHVGHIQANALFLGNPKNIQDVRVLEEKDD